MQVESTKHTLRDDAQGLLLGILLCSLGLLLLTDQGFLTGQTAGLALLITYITSWPFAAVFFVVNIPFYWLAWVRMGAEFTIKSLVCVTGLSFFSAYLPNVFEFGDVHPAAAAAIVGALIGSGLLIIIRHNGSLGGLGVLAVYLQDKTGFKAGWVQLIFDAGLFGVAALLLPTDIVLYSLAGAVLLNLIIAWNHRRDRYIAR